MAIRLIAGLGNPGPRYERTRHNIGAAWLQSLAHRFATPLKEQRKFKCLLGRASMLGRDIRLLLPTTYVNLSGEAVGAAAHFYKISPAEILVAYDEVAFAAGTTRLKAGGGHNGHNGIKSVIAGLGGASEFMRLRIGVGHPGRADRMVAYLTGAAMPATEFEAALDSAWLDDELLGLVLDGNLQQAMNLFHAPPAAATVS